MATEATVVVAEKDDTLAYLDVRVAGDGPGGSTVEYQARTPLVDAQGQAKSNAVLKAELVASCKAQRDAQRPRVRQALPISGTVNL